MPCLLGQDELFYVMTIIKYYFGTGSHTFFFFSSKTVLSNSVIICYYVSFLSVLKYNEIYESLRIMLLLVINVF